MRPAKVVVLACSDEGKLSVRRFLFRTRGYRVASAATAEEALAILGIGVGGLGKAGPDAEMQQVDLLLVELPLQGFGAEVLRQAKRLLPSLRTLLLCHHTEVEYDREIADVILPPEAGRAELLERAKILCIRKRGPTKKPPARALPPFGSKSDGVHLSDLRAARERHGATDPSYWKVVNGERVHFDPNVPMGAEFLEYGPKKKGAA